MRSIGLVTHPDYLAHQTGVSHPERPERLRAVGEHLQSTGLARELTLVEPRLAEQEWIETIHSPGYIRHVEEYCRGGRAIIDSMDTGISPRSYDVALLAAGGALEAADAIVEGRLSSAFCAARPPGHH